MIYNIRYLATYIVSLKVCNTSSKVVLYTRNAVKYSFLLTFIQGIISALSNETSGDFCDVSPTFLSKECLFMFF